MRLRLSKKYVLRERMKSGGFETLGKYWTTFGANLALRRRERERVPGSRPLYVAKRHIR